MKSNITTPLYARVASLLIAIDNCEKSNNNEWRDKHTTALNQLVKNFMPSGSGIDAGTKIDSESSKENRLVFTTAFHHMNEVGYYDGWTEHTIIVTPSLWHDFDMKITGKDRNQIKEYLHDVFDTALRTELDAEGKEVKANKESLGDLVDQARG